MRVFYEDKRPFCDMCVHVYSRIKRRPDSDETLRRFEKKLAGIQLDAPIPCDVCGQGFTYRECLQQFDPDPVFPNTVITLCPKCLKKALGTGRRCSRQAALAHVRAIFDVVGKAMIDGYSDLLYKISDSGEYGRLVRLLIDAPTEDQLAKQFGHYLKALIDAGILDPSEFRITEGLFGIRCVADDGHFCDSLIERRIDNFLHQRGVPHVRSPAYPGSKFLADWSIQLGSAAVFVEYFGLISRSEYRQKAEAKLQLAGDLGLQMVAIYPFDDWDEKLRVAIDRGRSGLPVDPPMPMP